MFFEEMEGTAKFQAKLTEEAVKAIVMSITKNFSDNISNLAKAMGGR